jgi:hypothetical protein
MHCKTQPPKHLIRRELGINYPVWLLAVLYRPGEVSVNFAARASGGYRLAWVVGCSKLAAIRALQGSRTTLGWFFTGRFGKRMRLMCRLS